MYICQFHCFFSKQIWPSNNYTSKAHLSSLQHVESISKPSQDRDHWSTNLKQWTLRGTPSESPSILTNPKSYWAIKRIPWKIPILILAAQHIIEFRCSACLAIHWFDAILGNSKKNQPCLRSDQDSFRSIKPTMLLMIRESLVGWLIYPVEIG